MVTEMGAGVKPSGLAASGIAILLCLVTPATRAGTPLETAVKATYLYKLAPFVTWPDGGSGPFTICVVGQDPFGAQLDRAVAGQNIGTRPFQVLRMDTVGPQSVCQIAYLGGSRDQSVAGALHVLHGMPVLTVTDEGEASGIIEFAVRDNRVRFRIDQAAAVDNGLSISSKLLSLALTVKPAKGAGQP